MTVLRRPSPRAALCSTSFFLSLKSQKLVTEEFCPKHYWVLTDAIPTLLHT